MANSVFLVLGPGGSGSSSGGTTTFAGTVASDRVLLGDGTALLPALAFTSEPTLGFWRNAATRVTLQGGLTTTTSITATTGLSVGATAYYNFLTRGYLQAAANGVWNLQNEGLTSGSTINVSALPTIASGFGSSPSITAGSTPLAGSVNVGTGAPGTTGTIAFGGTAFPSAPFAIVMNTTTGAVCRATTTTTQLIITAPIAFIAGDVISWLCIGSK